MLSQLIAGVEEGHEKDKVCRDFREIVGSIVLLAHPLSMFPLAKLLDITKHKLDHQLHLLHSVCPFLLTRTRQSNCFIRRSGIS